ncbi:hypothetical protein H0H93_005416 [Arthromyces matolae]|nr:hypothetical protein H0H93_005416 [Arthromyces matolae]
MDLASLAAGLANTASQHTLFPHDDALYEPELTASQHFPPLYPDYSPKPHMNTHNDVFAYPDYSPKPHMNSQDDMFAFQPLPPTTSSHATRQQPQTNFVFEAYNPPHRAATPPAGTASNNKREHSVSPQKPTKKARGKATGRSGQTKSDVAGSTKSPKYVPDDKDEVFANSRWSDEDRTTLFNFYLGPESDAMYERLKVNANYAHKKAAQTLFKKKYTESACKSQYQRAYETFNHILVFEGFTGGGGDGDIETPDGDLSDGQLEVRMTRARKGGRDLGKLSVKTYKKWLDNEWYTWFNDRMGKSSKVSRQAARHSLSAVSDAETIPSDSDSDPGQASVKQPTKSSSKVKKTRTNSDSDTTQTPKKEASKSKQKSKSAAQTVSEPKHQPASKWRVQSQSSLASMDQLLKIRTQSEKAKLRMLEAKQELQERKEKVEIAKLILSSPNTDEATRAKANETLLQLLM